jgi:hypothetical protein
MKLSTCKGEFEGSVVECSEWLEHMQPSMVAVVVGEIEATVDEHTLDARDYDGVIDENGCWRHGPFLRRLLLATEEEAREAGPQVVEFHPGLAVRVTDGRAADLAREVYAASDEVGTIQAEQMLALFPWGDPRWHTTTFLLTALSYVGEVFSPYEED